MLISAVVNGGLPGVELSSESSSCDINPVSQYLYFGNMNKNTCIIVWGTHGDSCQAFSVVLAHTDLLNMLAPLLHTSMLDGRAE